MKFFTVWLILSTPLFSDFTIKDRVAATLNSEIITQNDIYHECFVTKVESLISEETNHPKMLSPNKLRKICLENESKFLEFSLHNFLIINEIKKFGQLKLTKKERVKYKKI